MLNSRQISRIFDQIPLVEFYGGSRVRIETPPVSLPIPLLPPPTRDKAMRQAIAIQRLPGAEEEPKKCGSA